MGGLMGGLILPLVLPGHIPPMIAPYCGGLVAGYVVLHYRCAPSRYCGVAGDIIARPLCSAYLARVHGSGKVDIVIRVPQVSEASRRLILGGPYDARLSLQQYPPPFRIVHKEG